jgi:hypothetical protein
MSYDADAFVNNNAYNFSFAVEPIESDDDDMFDVYADLFVQQNNIAYDVLNQQADPVFVYELDHVPVAWYDCENFCGFVAK